MSLTPLVSIGMPIYNCEVRIAKALDSLLAQSYENIELIISDNGSTDKTWEICKQYASANPNIKLYHNKENRGPIYNFEQVLRLATGTYFMWAADDDFWDKNYVKICITLLLEHPNAVLAYGWEERHILKTDKRILFNHNFDLSHIHYKNRVLELLKRRSQPHSVIYGLMKREVALKGLPFVEVLDLDLLFLLKIAQYGPLISNKSIIRWSSISTKSLQHRLREINHQNYENIYFLLFKMHWQILGQFIKTTLEKPVNLLDRILISLCVFEWCIRHLLWSYIQISRKD